MRTETLKLIFTCLAIALLPVITRSHCTLSLSTFSCTASNSKTFLQEFYKYSCNADNISSTFQIHIQDSTFSYIDYFPKPFLLTHNFSITGLTIKNSSVEKTADKAFEELADLQYLDLSQNKLRNILFVKHLPGAITTMNLSYNNVTYLDDVFSQHRALRLLDISHNSITIVDLQNVFWVYNLNFSWNNIETLIPSKDFSRIIDLDLSYNKIKTFNELELNHAFYSLDISHNNLSKVVLAQSDKKFLGVSGNNITQFIVDKSVKVDYVDMSCFNTLIDFDKINLVAKQQLVLNNNKIEVLSAETLNVFDSFKKFWPYRPRVDLSNSSITDIAPGYFQGLETVLLNLSCNDITVLGNKVFYNSAIRILDLSNCNIERVQRTAFKNLTAELISLRSNKLEVIDMFDEVEVIELDLSFNRFKIVANHSFVACHGLFYLNLGYCSIEKIEPEAFKGLDKLQELVLTHNKLFILESNSFSNLPVRILQLRGNKIHTIRKNAFNNLQNLKELNLSEVALRNLEPYAFTNLIEVSIVDLRNNNISTIPHHLFFNTGKLRYLYLDGNNITTLNPFPNSLKLETLTLTFKGIFKSNQTPNLHIKHLHVVDSKIDVLKNNSFAGLYNLLELRFDNGHVYVETGALNHLFNLKQLDSRSLFKNMAVIQKGTFRDLKSLQHLDLSKLTLLSLESEAFQGLIGLETLLLNGNHLEKMQRNTFQGLESLQLLDLSSCNISECDTSTFTGLDSLKILHLEHNNLFSIQSEYLFGSLNNLLELHLDHNNISELHPKSFSSLSNLLELYLENNSLAEFPIGVFQYLTQLKVLNLSNNAVQLLNTGALSNLLSLKVLDLSYNQLLNLEYVDIFFSLKRLEEVYFDGNHLKQFDFKRFLINLKGIKYVGVSYNKWKCETLSLTIENFNTRNIRYTPRKPVFDADNIDGVGCVDMCKFVYCSHENVEQTLHK